LRGARLEEREVGGRVDKMLTLFKLEEFADRHPFALSRGQKRRLSVASMLVLRPEIFILDEPTTGQDWSNVVNMMDILMALHQEGLTILLVTHSMDLVAEYANRVIVMKEGGIAYDGMPEDLFSKPDEVMEQYYLEAPPVYRLIQRIRGRQPDFPVQGTFQKLSAFLEAASP